MVKVVAFEIEARFWQTKLLREANHHFNTPERIQMTALQHLKQKSSEGINE